MKKKAGMFFAAILLAAAGCTSPAVPAEPLTDEGRGEAIVKSIADADYRAFAGAAGETDNAPDADAFAVSCRELTGKCGKVDSFRYLGSLETPLLVNQLWAVRFVRRNGEGRTIAHEQLLQLIFGREEHKMRLLGMRFI